MAKLTHDTMFRYIDMITEWLEDRIGQDVIMSQDIESVTFHAGAPKWEHVKQKQYLPGFEPPTPMLDWDHLNWKRNGRSVPATHIH